MIKILARHTSISRLYSFKGRTASLCNKGVPLLLFPCTTVAIFSWDWSLIEKTPPSFSHGRVRGGKHGASRNTVFSPRTRWVPESARWLIANGKVKQAHRHLLRCARMNGRKDFAVSPEVRIWRSRHMFFLSPLLSLSLSILLLFDTWSNAQPAAWSVGHCGPQGAKLHFALENSYVHS